MSGLDEGRPFDVLLVEDNPGDVLLAKEALRRGKVPKCIHVAEDGVEAIAYLQTCGRNGAPRGPDLILLDLNLPRKSGHEVLAEIRADKHLRQTPVIIFTSSAAEQDICKAYELHANCYVTKPQGFAELTEVLEQIERFWLSTVTLPGRNGSHP